MLPATFFQIHRFYRNKIFVKIIRSKLILSLAK